MFRKDKLVFLAIITMMLLLMVLYVLLAADCSLAPDQEEQLALIPRGWGIYNILRR